MEITFKVAEHADLDLLLPFAQEFNREDHHPFDEVVVRAGLARLLDDRTAGRVWLIQARSEAVGYLVLTLGYRLAYGRYAFIDEIYVGRDYRSRGIGRRAIAFAEEMCRELDVRALHLEVERENTKARALYTALGFVDYRHHLMTCWLAEEQPQPVSPSPEITFKPGQKADQKILANLREQAGVGSLVGGLDSHTAVQRLVIEDGLGQIWLIEAAGRPIGYIAVTFSYSLEFHGRDALLDELYLRDPYRQDFGLPSLKFAQVWGRSLGVNALHVEVERDNSPAQAFYRAAGFMDDDSYLMTKWLLK
jgi:ribosomal protein S18 acetylase RimI-like enzyme